MHWSGNELESFPGYPADEARTLYVAPRTAEELTRLPQWYRRGVAPYQIRRGATAFGYTDRFGRPVEVRAGKDGFLIPRSGAEASAMAKSGLLRLPATIARDLRLWVPDFA